ncbi:hypothetical protein LCGC14_1920370 [marine sediment metagenome]|uniref:Uncharacterized protein n=1 Tax=marine sediment metagenome TaxID=412755 RepID=A0A0F9FRS7_9ZZZZ
MPQIRIEAEPEYNLISKVGSIDLEYGIKGTELERNLQGAQEAFIRSMELRGYTLAKTPGNPQWVTDSYGRLSANYAIDWTGERRQKVQTAGGLVETANKKETSLEETGGMVEYRIVGIFYAPEVSIEMLRHPGQAKDEERLAKKPTSFGAGGIQLPGTPSYPGEAEINTDPKSDPRVQRGQPIPNGNKRPNPEDQRLIDDGQRSLSG